MNIRTVNSHQTIQNASNHEPSYTRKGAFKLSGEKNSRRFSARGYTGTTGESGEKRIRPASPFGPTTTTRGPGRVDFSPRKPNDVFPPSLSLVKHFSRPAGPPICIRALCAAGYGLVFRKLPAGARRESSYVQLRLFMPAARLGEVIPSCCCRCCQLEC